MIKKNGHDEAASKASKMWRGAKDATADHQYCKDKQVAPYGLRMIRFKDGTSSLLVPLYDEDGNLRSLQLIREDGPKIFLADSQTKGCHFWVADPDETKSRTICICEGWATGESIYQATRYAVILAFYAANLKAVAEWVRGKYPEHKIVICADDDWKSKGNPGHTSAEEAARAIGGLIAIPAFDEKRARKDTDFNDMARAKGYDSVKAAIDSAAEVLETEPDETGPQNPSSKDIDTLLKLASAAELFHDEDDKGYANVAVEGHRETWPTGSKGFSNWLRHLYFNVSQTAPSSDALTRAIATISARAQYAGSARKVFLRVGSHDGKIYLDLCDQDWRVVEVDPDGWRVVSNPPVRFRRTNGMRPLPVPVRAGSLRAPLEKLRWLLNLNCDDEPSIDDPDFVLFVSCLLAGLSPRGPYPILKPWGETGSAKTTMTRLYRRLVDPNKVDERHLPSGNRDLYIAASNAWVLSFGNISSISEELSNVLCNLSTGGGFATREALHQRGRADIRGLAADNPERHRELSQQV